MNVEQPLFSEWLPDTPGDTAPPSPISEKGKKKKSPATPMDAVGVDGQPLPKAGGGFENKGAYLPQAVAAANPIGATLTNQMMQQGNVDRTRQDFMDFLRKMPQASPAFTPAAAGSLESLTPAGGAFRQESDVERFNRALGAYGGLEKIGTENERLALDKYLGVGKQGLDTQKLELEKALGLGELGVKTGRLGLDTVLGKAKAGVEAGQLEIGQRAQQAKEQELSFAQGKGATLGTFNQALAAGKELGEARTVAEEARGLIGRPGTPRGFGVNAQGLIPVGPVPRVGVQGGLPPVTPQQMAEQDRAQREVQGVAAAQEKGQGGSPPAPAVPLGEAGSEATRTLQEERKRYGHEAYKMAQEAAKANPKDAAGVLLALRKGMSGGEAAFAQVLPQALETARRLTSPRDVDIFLNPSKSRQVYRRAMNMFPGTRLDADEVLMSQIRNKMGLPPVSGNPLEIIGQSLGGNGDLPPPTGNPGPLSKALDWLGSKVFPD